MFCANCGEQLKDDMLFCPKCGTKVGMVTPRESKEGSIAEGMSEESKEGSIAEGMSEESKEGSIAEEMPEESKEGSLAEGMPEESKEGSIAEGMSAESREGGIAEGMSEESREGGIAEEKAQETKKTEVNGEGKVPVEKNNEAKEGKPKVKQILSMIGRIVAVIFSIILGFHVFVWGLLACASTAIRVSYSGARTYNLLSQMDVENIRIPSPQTGREVSAVDFIEEVSGFDFEKTAKLKKDDILKFLAKPYVKEMVADYVSSYMDYLFTGQEPIAFTRDDLVEFISEHDDDIFEAMRFRFTYVDPRTNQKVIYTVDIDNAFQDMGTNEINLDWMQQNSGIDLKGMQAFVSYETLNILIILSLIVIIIILGINFKHLGFGVVVDGVVFLMIGLVMDATTGIAYLLYGGKENSIVSYFLAPLFRNSMVIGSIFVAVGLICFLFARDVLHFGMKKKS